MWVLRKLMRAPGMSYSTICCWVATTCARINFTHRSVLPIYPVCFVTYLPDHSAHPKREANVGADRDRIGTDDGRTKKQRTSRKGFLFCEHPHHLAENAMSSFRPRSGLSFLGIKSMTVLLVIALAGCGTSRQSINPQRVESDDLVVGAGAEAKRGMDVTVHYRGMLANGDVFNTSYKTNEPYRFKLGAYRVISGWDEGIVG